MDADPARADLAGALDRMGPRWAEHGRRLAAPVTVSVSGRPGVGVSTVVRALNCAGCAVGDDGDVRVRIIAEVVKPEDHAALRSACIVVRTKTDLADDAGPGLRGLPLRGLLAVAGLDPEVIDDEMRAALRTLTSQPADLGSVDAFRTAPHAVAAAVRCRLLDRLDLFGIARAVLELRAVPDLPAAGLRRVLRDASGIDAVLGQLDVAIAEVRYRRLCGVAAELEALAAADPDAAALLYDERTVAARESAAAAVVQSAGVAIGGPGAVEAQRWRRYGDGPVTALQRAAATDLARWAMR